jgi:SEC-C motif
MESILPPKTSLRRNAPCPCGSGKRYKHCHGAIATIQPNSFAPNRFAEFEAQMFAAMEASADPAMRLNNHINRLIMESKSHEAAALLIQELPRFLPSNAPQAFGTRTTYSIQRLVIGNSHPLMRNADAADIEEACGLPVVLADLIAGRGMEDLAPGTLVILTGHTQQAEPNVLRAIKAHGPGCIALAWLFDNHHGYLANAQAACSADLCFPSHPMPTDYLSHVAPGRIGPTIPLATGQWSRPQLTSLWKRFEREGRSDALSGHYAFYALAHGRNALLAKAIEEWPQADLSLRHFQDLSYHARSPADRFLQWRSHKTSVCLPVANDLSNRFFDALATGQVPIVASDILDLDRVIPPDLQTSLPIIRLQDYTVAALRDAHGRAIAAFDSEGNEGAERRHRFVLRNHMLANRIRLLVDETMSPRPLAGFGKKAGPLIVRRR